MTVFVDANDTHKYTIKKVSKIYVSMCDAHQLVFPAQSMFCLALSS